MSLKQVQVLNPRIRLALFLQIIIMADTVAFNVEERLDIFRASQVSERLRSAVLYPRLVNMVQNQHTSFLNMPLSGAFHVRVRKWLYISCQPPSLWILPRMSVRSDTRSLEVCSWDAHA